jgi:2-keto-4-pentenoate hydratase/2-oxohepta-3-ene-1,7-dioic acid hydratase in catechol pathway
MMRLANSVLEDDPMVIVELDGQAFAPPAALRGKTLFDLLCDWDRAAPVLQAFAFDPGEPLALPPPTEPALNTPGKILCAGANYRDHMEEMGLPEPPHGVKPYLFLKPTTAIVGTGAIVQTSLSPESRVDYEAELGVVIGTTARNLSVADAASAIAGYIVANDVSARGAFRVSSPLGPPFAFDWLAHKGQDGFCPIGPWFVPAWSVADVADLGVRSTVNGELRQNGNTKDMLFSPAELISFATSLTTLHPGDILLTGTPAGVAAADGRFLKDGDSVTVSIDSIGDVSNLFQWQQHDSSY